VTALATAPALTAQRSTPAPGAEPLGAIVGVWQSDATQGVSAKSSCEWTPQGNGAVWTYGGLSAGPGGRWFRTINDFSKRDEYSWRLETSDDGKSWRTANGGQSRRVLPSKR